MPFGRTINYEHRYRKRNGLVIWFVRCVVKAMLLRVVEDTMIVEDLVEEDETFEGTRGFVGDRTKKIMFILWSACTVFVVKHIFNCETRIFL